MGCLKLHILDEYYKRPELKVSCNNKKLTSDFCAENVRRALLYGFGGHEKVDEVSGTGNTVDMGDRWLDVRLGRTSKLDRKATDYPSLSPYSYAANNPIMFIDPDGQAIKVANTESFNVLLSSLPAEARSMIKITDDNFIDATSVNAAYSQFSNSGNMQALRDIVADDRIVDFNATATSYNYISAETGKTETNNFQSPIRENTYQELLSQFEGTPQNKQAYAQSLLQQGYVDEVEVVWGNFGAALRPSNAQHPYPGGQISPTNNFQVYINPVGTTPTEQAKNVGHELFGHIYQFFKGKDPRHATPTSNPELNRQIINSEEESVINSQR